MVGNDYLLVELIHFTAPAPTDTTTRDVHAVGFQKTGVYLGAKAYDEALARLRRLGASFVGGEFTDDRLRMRTFIVKDNSLNYLQFFAAAR